MKSPANNAGEDRRVSIFAIIAFALSLLACLLGGLYVMASADDHRKAIAFREAKDELQVRRVAEIEAIKGRMRAANSKHEMTCANAAGFHYPEESTERELARMQRIEICINQLSKSEAR